MVSVLNRKLKREFLSRRGILAAIVAIIMTGVSGYVALTTSHANLVRARDDYYARCQMADFSVELKKVPLSELDPLDDIPGITGLESRITFSVTADIDGVEKPVSGRVISLPAEPRPHINRVLVQRGNYFTATRHDEVLINEAFAEAHGLSPGDKLTLILNNRLQELAVVGTVVSPEFIYLMSPGALIPDPESYGVFYIKRPFAEEVFGFQGACNQIVGLLAPEVRDRPQRLLDELETRLDDYGVVTTTPRSNQPSHTFLNSEIDGLRVMSKVLPAIFLSVAAVILNVLMLRIAEQQRVVVGTLRALGYDSRTLFVHYLKFGTMIGLAGGVLGVLAGFAMAGGMTVIYKQFFSFPELVNQPLISTLIIGVGVSVFFSVLGTLRGLRTIIQLKPAEAMRPRPPRRGRPIFLEGWKAFWNRIDFRWQMVLRGIVRQRMRTIAGLFAAAVGAAMMLVTFFMRDSMVTMVEFQFEKILLSDFEVSFKDNVDEGALFEMQRLPGVDHVEPVFSVACTLRNGRHHKKGAILGIVPDARLTIPRDTAGRRLRVPDVGVLLTNKLARILDVRVGDTINVEPIRGRRDPVPVTVTAVADSFIGMSVYASFDYLNRLVGESRSVSSLQVKVDPQPAATLSFYRRLKRIPAVQSVSAIRDNKHQLDEILVDKLLVSVAVMTGFAGLIFFGSVMNSSLISLSERRQEIATFRVLGYTPAEVGAIFLRESLLLNLIGAVLGLPLGYWMCIEYGKLIDTDLFRLPFVISPLSWALTIVLALVFTLLAHIPVRRTIMNLDWLDALNVKE